MTDGIRDMRMPAVVEETGNSCHQKSYHQDLEVYSRTTWTTETHQGVANYTGCQDNVFRGNVPLSNPDGLTGKANLYTYINWNSTSPSPEIGQSTTSG